MDVLHITEACGAGVRRHLGLILPALQARGIECGLFAFGSRFEDGFMDEFASVLSNVLFERMEVPRPIAVLKAASIVRRLCREWRPRTIHCHAFAAGVAARIAAPRGVRILYSPHAFGINAHIPFLSRIAATIAERTLKGRTDGFVLVGEGEREDAARLGIPKEMIAMAPNGLSQSILDQFLPREEARRVLEIPDSETAVVAPCRLAQQKGLAELVDAWRHLDGTVLHIYGDGPMRSELERLIVHNSLEGRILLHGVKPSLNRCLRAFDAGVLPSFYEGLSYSLLEMLAAGIPVAASDIPANRIANGIRFFQTDDRNSIAAAVSAAISTGPNQPIFPFTLEEQIGILTKLYN